MTAVPEDAIRLADELEAAASADLYAAAPAELGMRVERRYGATLLLAPKVPVSYFNRVIGLGVAEPATEAALDAIVSRYRAAGVDDHWIHVSPAAAPAAFADWLLARGYAPPVRRSWAKFVRGADAPPVARADAPLVRAAERQDAGAVAAVACSAFGLPATLAPWFERLVGRPGWCVLVAELDGRIVATGSLYVVGTGAWLGIGATLAEHRKRGAQGALLAERIRVAAAAGCATLATETGETIAGEPSPSLENIRRAGFAQVCSRLNYAAPR